MSGSGEPKPPEKTSAPAVVEQQQRPAWPAKVVHVLSSTRVVINRGAENGVRLGMRFLVYELGREIFDPDSKASLGQLEIVRGTGTVVHLQPKLATLESDQKEKAVRRVTKRRDLFSIVNTFGPEEVTEYPSESVPFDSPEEGDIAKPI